MVGGVRCDEAGVEELGVEEVVGGDEAVGGHEMLYDFAECGVEGSL
jgi:H2-forming N5,N10-methylenetetrahydromethanopterin dehydrogenase-like enzyme